MSAEAYVQALTGWAALLRLLYQQPQADLSVPRGTSWPTRGQGVEALTLPANTCPPAATVPHAALPLCADSCTAALTSPLSGAEPDASQALEALALSGGPVTALMPEPSSVPFPTLLFGGGVGESGSGSGIGAVPVHSSSTPEWASQPLALHSLLQLRLLGLGLGTAFEGGSVPIVPSAIPSAGVGNGIACSMHNVSANGIKTTQLANVRQPPRPNPHPKPPFSYIALITMVCITIISLDSYHLRIIKVHPIV